ncbi:MAG: hypothetical protein U9M97_03140 [Candidatus Hadarchaeota archaeon]|nr:hypothetical protein [Candidatus Hadarchaeota archaeon]
MSDALTLESLRDEIAKLRREVEEIGHRVGEDFELSDRAKKRLKEYGRRKETPVAQEEVEREFMG